jgi:DNA-binding NarL/FixJ family response regulator
VLIVDDDGWTRYALARLFQWRNVPTVAASSLSEGIAFLDRDPACVVLDLNLPDGAGEALLRTVRERRLSCRVVVCTVIVDPRRLERLSRLAPDAFLQKPIEIDRLARACCV